MNKIIVPIDFSEHSEYALEAAVKLAKNGDTEILALHMLEISDAVLNKTDSEQQQKAIFFLRLAEKRFNEFLDKPYLKNVNITPIVKHFKVFSEVNDVALEHNADLIIMGSHGSSGLSEIFVGSNTEKVVRHADIPVLVLKHKFEKDNFKDVVFASDFSSKSVAVYLKASKLFKALNAKLHLLYVNLPSDRFKSTNEIDEIVATFLMTADGNLDNLQHINFVSDYTVEKGVLNFANKIGADLIAVATHGRTGIAHFFEGSISEDIANHAILPVMTFKL
ncbi:universal stress protein [Xanthomarina spongicola]|uniref:Nucleotide-binding universal stress UspA family protein n=1 Tax=Xanthomarina spongicola TaxID=570520 RepID=A0A316DKL6_9FLAO|nr:universal stress protein [Xanthomarina spongicola]PWK17233.1 nucleotide-binding universal stress UspA family protein [Xanthomarina spongicola]